MEGNTSRKRSFPDDDDSNKPPAQKKVRFPKGKKAKQGDYMVDLRQNPKDVPGGWKDPRLAAQERSMHRNQAIADLFIEENRRMPNDISQAEIQYEDDETFVDDGIQIEPFNLTEEREQGYFDAEGNFVEYADDNDIKDAWLDNIDVDTKFARKNSMITNNEDDVHDLSSEEIGKIKRRIADVLQPGETILQALRRLRGTSNSEKMSGETKVLFDQLTEDSMKLMDNGDYNVYEEKQEIFRREAEGYERIAQARGDGTSMSSGQEKSDNTVANYLVTNGMNEGQSSSVIFQTAADSSNLNISAASSYGDDTFDIFGEDDENAAANPLSNGNNLVPGHNPDRIGQPSESGDLQNDYVYDDSSGYYYSSSLGYYYDPSSGLYCYAASGQWYSYNEETATYNEIQEAAANLS